MATKIKDTATAERAALKLNEGIEVPQTSEPTAPREKTTTEKLFPDFMTDDGAIINRPVRSKTEIPAPVNVAATPIVTPQGQTPAAQPPTAPVYLDIKELTGKMVKLKVDGIEQDVPAESLIKTNQLERHLNTRLMEVAQEAKKLEDERRALRSQPQPPMVQPPIGDQNKKEPAPKKTSEVEFLEARLAQLEQVLQPTILESGLKRMDAEVKARTGADDFMSYAPKIQELVNAERMKPENQNPQAQTILQSSGFWYQQYQDLKIKALTAKLSAPTPTTPTNPTAPVLQTQQGAPVVINNAGQPVTIPSFEGSSGVPNRQSPDASWQSTYDSLVARAQAQNTNENWMAVMRHKFSRGNEA
jgi:hypothetical protein